MDQPKLLERIGSSGQQRLPLCRSVTFTPKVANSWANSQPTGPPTTMIRRADNVRRFTASTLVIGAASSRPGMSGRAGRPPVAIRMRSPRSTRANADVVLVLEQRFPLEQNDALALVLLGGPRRTVWRMRSSLRSITLAQSK